MHCQTTDLVHFSTPHLTLTLPPAEKSSVLAQFKGNSFIFLLQHWNSLCRSWRSRYGRQIVQYVRLTRSRRKAARTEPIASATLGFRGQMVDRVEHVL
jgi:hypothetical protein